MNNKNDEIRLKDFIYEEPLLAETDSILLKHEKNQFVTINLEPKHLKLKGQIFLIEDPSGIIQDRKK